MSVQPRAGGKFQLRVQHKLLPKPFFHTFDGPQAETDARNYGIQLTTLLRSGVVPIELMAPAERAAMADPMLAEVIGDYQRLAPVTVSDDDLLKVVRHEVGSVRVFGVTMRWAEVYVAGLKSPDRERGPLKPGSIRKRVGVLGRVLDWHFRRAAGDDKDAKLPINVMRIMPANYSIYTKQEAAKLPDGPPEDQTRTLRLPPADEVKLRAALAGQKREDRERPLQPDPEFTMLTDLIIDTGARLTEGMTLRVEQVDLAGRLIHLDGTKGRRGKVKPRVVPIKRVLLDKLTGYCAGRTGLMFPTLWDGKPESKRRASQNLTARYRRAFDYAGLDALTEHDLRHEATCRWFELRRPDGSWVFSAEEICKLMGWTDTKLALRYLSLRGEDLAKRLGDF